jgi:hypothetical protein
MALILIEEYGDGRRKEYTAIKGGLATEIPLVVSGQSRVPHLHPRSWLVLYKTTRELPS